MLSNLWEEFLKILNVEAGSRIVETWFKAISFERWNPETKTIFLKAPNNFVREWISLHYQSFLKKNLARLLNESEVNIVFENVSEKENSGENFKNFGNDLSGNKGEIKPVLACKKKNNIVENFSFENFVVGPNSALSHAAANAVAQSVGNLYNPLVICGGSGLGKTHLLKAIGNKIKKEDGNKKVFYQSSEKFTREFVAAIRMNNVQQFEDRYKNIDVLLIDDIQFISEKKHTQEIFFQIFNSLKERNKQIVFTCDRLPKDIAGFSDRVWSRLESGLTTSIHPPSLETKIEILQKKAAGYNIELSVDIAEQIVSRSNSNIRDLENTLSKMIAHSSLSNEPINEDIVGQVLPPMQSKFYGINLDSILKQVSKYYSFSVDDLRSSKRTKTLIKARHVAMYLMKKLTDKSLREIADFIGKKDHSTILYAYKKLEALRQSDFDTDKILRDLEKKIVI